jgi:hypothetical protein
MGRGALFQPPACLTLAILRGPRLGVAILFTTMADIRASKAMLIIRTRSRNCIGRMAMTSRGRTVKRGSTSISLALLITHPSEATTGDGENYSE